MTSTENVNLQDKIYFIRGQRVMLDRDLAEIYGYETRTFNQQVKNNRERFDDDFYFQLLPEEIPNSLMSKVLTLNVKGNRRGLHIKKLPYAFTEQGIYMLMTVLKGDLVVRQSKALVRLFKQMKDYLLVGTSPTTAEQMLYLASKVDNNSHRIERVEKQMVKQVDLQDFMMTFSNKHLGQEFLILNGQALEADVAYKQIFVQAEKSIILVDNYINSKTLLFFAEMDEKVKVTIFSDNVGGGLRKNNLKDFRHQYPQVKLNLQQTGGIIHDRMIVLDSGTAKQKFYVCGSSLKDGGKRVTTIVALQDSHLADEVIIQLRQQDKLKLL